MISAMKKSFLVTLIVWLSTAVVDGLVASTPLKKVPNPTLIPSSNREGNEATLPLRIDGIWYNLQSYADKHKGGRWLLEYARGRDVTPIFYAIHMHGEEKAKSVLKSLPTLDTDQVQHTAEQGPYVVALDESVQRSQPTIDSALRRDLQQMVRRKFPTIESTKATSEHWARTVACAVVCTGCWAGWLQGNLLAVLLLPLAQWLLAAHTVHEATHGALSTNPTINYWAQFTAHPILFNVYVWIPQHLLSHHQYTNDPQHDCDVHHFAAARLAKEQPSYTNPDVTETSTSSQGWTFVWKGCLTTLGTCILQPMRTLRDTATPNFDVNITPIPSAVSNRTLLLSMLPSFFVMLYPTIATTLLDTMSPSEAAVCTFWPWVGMSIIWTAMTQSSHIQNACQWDEAKASNICWTAQQIETAMDYSVGNPTVTWATAGLNNQGLHHAMPTIAHCHFADLYEEYETICRKHGVEPRQTQDLASACRECLSYVFELNDPTKMGAGA